MSESTSSSSRGRVLIAVLVFGVLSVGIWWFLEARGTWQRGEGLVTALSPLIGKENSDQSLVARAILDNYLETRANASRWSGVYWGFTFIAAALSAMAGLILKVETIIKNEGMKKDIAAVSAVAAALLITIAASGDFQRKWQANRIAAAELERTGYELLEMGAADPRSHLASVGQILYRRHIAIVGATERRKPSKLEIPADPTAGPGENGTKTE